MSSKLKYLLLALLMPIVLVALVCLYFADNIQGYYQFKEICAKEGGLKLYQPLERDVGWFADGDIYSAIPMISYDAVAFVRYHNEKDGQWYDVYRAKKLKVGDPGYAQQPADLTKPAVYQRKWSTQDLPNEIRMGITKTEFIDLRTNKTVASYSEFGYSKFNPNNTLLGAPSGEGCPEQGGGTDPITGKAIPPHEVLAIRSIFKLKPYTTQELQNEPNT